MSQLEMLYYPRAASVDDSEFFLYSVHWSLHSVFFFSLISNFFFLFFSTTELPAFFVHTNVSSKSENTTIKYRRTLFFQDT